MTTYYTNQATGSDGNSGLDATTNALRTIQAGINKLGSGDTLIIKAGTYKESVSVGIAKSGSSTASPTTISGADGETVIIDGEYLRPGATTMIFSGQIGGVVQPKNDGSGNYYYNDPSRPTNGSTIRPVYYSRLFDVQASYVLIENLTIQRSLGYLIGNSNAAISPHHITVDGCTLRGSRNASVSFYRGHHITISDCHVYDAANFATFGRPSTNWGFNWPAIQAMDTGSYSSVWRNCIVHDAWGEGLYCSNRDGIIENCTVYDTWRTLIYFERTQRGIVRNNHLYSSGTIRIYNQADPTFSSYTTSSNPYLLSNSGMAFHVENWQSPYSGNAEYCQIYNNLVVGTNGGILVGGPQDISGANGLVRGNKIYNNTVVNSFPHVIWTNYPGSIGNEIYNNVFYGGSAISQGTAGTSSFSIHHNIYGVTPGGVTLDADSIVGNPLLANPTVDIQPGSCDPADYQLQSGSSARNAGTPAGAPTTDYYGEARGSTIDMGALAYGSAPPVDPEVGTIDSAFTATPLSGTDSQLVAFTDTSTADNTITSWAWDKSSDSGLTWTEFSTAEDPSETFSIGLWSVRLRVESSDGFDFETKLEYIEILTSSEPPDVGDVSPIVSSFHGAANATSYTLDNAITPNVGIFAMSGATADATAMDNARLGYGFSSATVRGAIAVSATNGSTDLYRQGNTYSVMIPQTVTHAPDSAMTASSFSPGAMGATWPIQSSAWKLSGLLMEAEDHAIGSFKQVTSDGGEVTLSLSFTPNVILFSSILSSSLPAGGGTNLIHSYGFATSDGNQVSYCNWTTTASAAAYLASNRAHCYATSPTGALANSIEVVNFGGGFTARSHGTSYPTTPTIYYCAMKLVNPVWCGIIDTPTATGLSAHSGMGIAPSAMLMIQTMMQSADAADAGSDAAAMGVGIYANGNEYAHNIAIEDGASPLNSQSYSTGSSSVLLSQDDGGAGYAATVDSVQADGVTLDYTAVLGAARKILVLAIGGGFVPEVTKRNRGMYRGMRRGI